MKKYTKEQIAEINNAKDIKKRNALIKFADVYNKAINYDNCTEKLAKEINTTKNIINETDTEIILTINKANNSAYKKMTSKQAYLLQNNENVKFTGSNCGFGYYVNRINITEASKLINAALNNKKVFVKA